MRTSLVPCETLVTLKMSVIRYLFNIRRINLYYLTDVMLKLVFGICEHVFLALNRDSGTEIPLNYIRINGSTDQLSVMSNTGQVDDTSLGFATLPRIPKKFTLKNEDFESAECSPVQQRVPSKSTPDLLKLYRLPIYNASPKLKRANACKVKRDSARTSAEEEVDEQCVEVINDKG